MLLFTGINSVAYRDPDDPSAPTVRGWMLTSTDDHVLLTVKPSFLVVPSDGLPDGVQLRVRAGPDAGAAEVRDTAMQRARACSACLTLGLQHLRSPIDGYAVLHVVVDGGVRCGCEHECGSSKCAEYVDWSILVNPVYSRIF